MYYPDPDSPDSKKPSFFQSKKKIIVGGLVLTLGGAVLASMYAPDFFAPVAPAEFVPKVAKIPPAKAAGAALTPVTAKREATLEKGSASEKHDPALSSDPPLPAAGSVARLTVLRSELEEVKLKVAIEEQWAKLKKDVPQPVLMPPLPAIPQSGLGDLNSLNLEANQSTNKAEARNTKTRVISIQGVNGKLTATLRTPEGIVTLAPGERLPSVSGGATISKISRAGVQTGQNLLPFE